MNYADAFMTGNMPPEDADVAGYGFVKHLTRSSGRFQTLLEALRAGMSIDQALVKSHGAGPRQLAAAWSGRPAGGR
jgi:hypothetical protein